MHIRYLGMPAQPVGAGLPAMGIPGIPSSAVIKKTDMYTPTNHDLDPGQVAKGLRPEPGVVERQRGAVLHQLLPADSPHGKRGDYQGESGGTG